MSLIQAASKCNKCFKSWMEITHRRLKDEVNNEFDCHLNQLISELGQDLITESEYKREKDFIEKLRCLCYYCDYFTPQIASVIEQEVLTPLRKKVFPDYEREALEFARIETNNKVVSIRP